MKYLYCCWITPSGPVSMFYRGEEHVLAKAPFDNARRDILRAITQKTGQIMPDQAMDMIALQNVIELPLEVAKERFPNDFESISNMILKTKGRPL